MKKGFLRCIAVIMVVIMTAVCAPITEISDMFTVEASAIVTNGKVNLGSNIKWTYDSKTKTITVSGSGSMYNYANGDDGQRWDELVLGLTHYPNKHAENLVISNGITNIGNNVFNGLKGIKSVTIPSSVTSIGTSAFKGCTALTSVKIPSSVTSIGTSAFEGCSALTTVTIPSSVKTIGSNAFKNTKAAKITIPDSVTSIGSGAFSGISGLKITCNYGTYAYDYCVKNSVSCALPANILVSNVVYNNDIVTVTLKMVYNQAKFNAGNFTFTYTNATPVDKTTVVKTDTNDVTTAVVYNGTGKVSVSIMAMDYVPYSSNVGICEYTLAELKFKLNCKSNKSEFNFNADTLMMNEAKTSIKSASATAKLSHTYKATTTKATLTKNGSITNVCSACGYVQANTAKTIYYPKTFTLSATKFTYSGSAKAPNVTVKDSNGATLKKDTDYTVKYASAKTNVGTYPVTITFKGNYSGTKTLNYEIVPDSSSKTITLSATKYTYNGSAKAPGVTVKDSRGKTLVKGTDYTATYASAKTNPGKYAVTVTFKGNYSGTQTAYYLILPSKTSKITPTRASTTIKATWNAVTGASGYKVELLSSSNSVLKTVHTSNCSYSFTGLTGGTDYKIRVTAYKTINSVKEYSLTSTTLSTSTTFATPPLTVSSTTKGKASFSWGNISGETGYQIYYSTNSSSGFTKLGTYTANTTSATKSNLTSGKTYYFKIRAYKKVGDSVIYSSWSPVQSVKIK